MVTKIIFTPVKVNLIILIIFLVLQISIFKCDMNISFFIIIEIDFMGINVSYITVTYTK